LGSKIYRCPNPLRYGKDFTQVLKIHGPFSVVHSHCDPSGLPLRLARRQNVPVRIAHSHMSRRELGSHGQVIQKLFLPLAKRWLHSNASAGFAVSSEAAIGKFGKDWKQDSRWTLFPPGIDLANFTAAGGRKLKEELGISQGTLVLGHVAR